MDTAVLEGILSFQNCAQGRWLGSSPYCDGFFSLPPSPCPWRLSWTGDWAEKGVDRIQQQAKASWPDEPTGGYILHVAIGSEMPLGARLALWPVYLPLISKIFLG